MDIKNLIGLIMEQIYKEIKNCFEEVENGSN